VSEAIDPMKVGKQHESVLPRMSVNAVQTTTETPEPSETPVQPTPKPKPDTRSIQTQWIFAAVDEANKAADADDAEKSARSLHAIAQALIAIYLQREAGQ
jgi:hypothetical protein